MVSFMALASSVEKSSNAWVDLMSDIRFAGPFGMVVGHLRLSVWKSLFGRLRSRYMKWASNTGS